MADDFPIAEILDYEFAGRWSNQINKPTKYKGKGRPKKTDYALFKHPWDKEITKCLNK